MIKRITFILLSLLIIFGVLGNQLTYASTNDGDGINEKLGVPSVVYGDTLSEAQEKEVRKMLDVQNRENVDEYRVNGQDIANYIDGNPNSRMFSSVKITPNEKGKGLEVNLVTPDKITQVTKEMYKNALLTAGVEDATVDVASPVKVSGHSALTGIYKAYDEKGVKLDQDRMKVADEELGVATKLAEDAGISPEKVSELMTNVKKEIAQKNPASKEEVEQIINDQLKSLNIELSPEDRQLLTDLFNKIRNLNINFDEVQKQLDEITSNVKDLINDKGFWNNVSNFFNSIMNALTTLINSLLS